MLQTTVIGNRRGWIAVLCAAVATAFLAPAAPADEFVDQANRAGDATAGTEPAEDVLFPALAAMDEPPLVIEGPDRAGRRDLMILTPDDASRWNPLERWAAREAQQAALEALRTVTDPDETYILGIPYDGEGVDPAWQEAGLHCSMGEHGYLVNVEFHYLERVRWLATLALFESARLASEGDGRASLEVLRDLVRFGRMLAERAFAQEKIFAFELLDAGIERLRDVVYTYPESFDPDQLTEVAEQIYSGALTIMRIPLPEGDRLTAEQLLARLFEERGGARPQAVADVMSAAATGDRPLRLFSHAAWWADLAERHADWFDTGDRIGEIWKDYVKRWDLPFTNEIHETPTHFMRVDASRYPVLYASMKHVEPLFGMRFDLMLTLGATYNGLGVQAFRLRQRSFPPQLAAIHPTYVEHRVKDITNLDDRYIEPQPRDFGYKVPIRDDVFGRREDPHPYEVTVVLSQGAVDEAVAGDAGAAPALPEMNFDASMLADPEFDFGDFPTEIFDRESFRVTDVERLREYLIGKVRDMDISREEMADLNATMPLGAAIDVERAIAEFADMPRDEVRAELAPRIRADLSEMRPLLEGFGIDVDAAIDLMTDMVVDFAQNREYLEVVRDLAQGRDVSEAQLRQASESIIETVITERYVNGVLGLVRPVVDSMGGIDAVLLGLTGPSEYFTASLDDSVFMLWAAGVNGTNDRARVVGPPGVGADDILFWPPIIALEREFNR